MISRTTLALGFAAALFSVTVAGTAYAKTRHQAMMHRPMHHSMAMGGHSARAMPSDADHSADSLNGQSLTRTQSGQ